MGTTLEELSCRLPNKVAFHDAQEDVVPSRAKPEFSYIPLSKNFPKVDNACDKFFVVYTDVRKRCFQPLLYVSISWRTDTQLARNKLK
ncbi:Hypothetical predicted protein [Olea europaea subsp. europaea]|uniref:Uncharacterized protein n=1 Tax=Olea europaea subsp. europaea TaxID=158383 RepID=A0A8S0PP71_OLEEU|nr:Hypothetical predicted protein [Olea europaea subsp. europaea]